MLRGTRNLRKFQTVGKQLVSRRYYAPPVSESGEQEPKFLQQVGLYFDKAANTTLHEPGLLSYIKVQ